MIDFKVQFTRIKIDATSLRLDDSQRRDLGQFALDTLKRRVSQGLGSNDAPMPALRPRYKALKVRRTGRSIRDLRFTGNMLENLSVRPSDTGEIVIAFTTESARVKAFQNQQRAPWFGFSPADMRKIAEHWWTLQGRNIERFLLPRAA
jgi:hypothetical protein